MKYRPLIKAKGRCGAGGMKKPFLKRAALLTAACFAGASTTIVGAAAELDLTTMPLEKLLDLEVTILRGNDPLFKAPAAISVVTQDDIRRSGALTLPEALRLVPGLHVAQVDAGQWAVSARGFNDVFANKLLVLQDGRSIYSPLFSGVFWDVQGTMMEDIDRIEVIRGPGASLWGANAVNGVINIITKSAKKTQGTLISAGAGNVERGFASARYGGQMGSNAFFRVYGTYMNHDHYRLRGGAAANDAWEMGRWGFRTDWDVNEFNTLTFQGDGYLGALDQTFGTYDPTNPFGGFYTVRRDTMQVRGGNALGRWTRAFSDTSELKAQVYYDRTERDTVIFKEKRDTVDLDVQHRFAWGDRNEMAWGFGYRFTSDNVVGSPTISLNPARDSQHLFNLMVQDEISLIPNTLKLTLGSKFEHNDFTGFEIQPGARLAWTPNNRHTVWASVSRAIRTPSRSEDATRFNQIVPPDTFFPGSPLGVLTVYGDERRQAEELIATELGYRVQPHAKVSLDLAAFYNMYDGLRSTKPGVPPDADTSAPPPPPDFVFPTYLSNGGYGETYGFEAAVTWEVTGWWRLQPRYTFMDMNLRLKDGHIPEASEEGKTPHHQFLVHSSMDLPHNVSLDCILRYVDRLPAFPVNHYLTLDARIGWRPTKNLELSVVGQNLFQPLHAEFRPSFVQTERAEVPRSVYGKITWHF